MKLKNIVSKSAIALMLFSLVACGSKGTNESANNETVKSKFPLIWDSKKEPLEGGVAKYAVVSPSPFKGILSSSFYT